MNVCQIIYVAMFRLPRASYRLGRVGERCKSPWESNGNRMARILSKLVRRYSRVMLRLCPP